MRRGRSVELILKFAKKLHLHIWPPRQQVIERVKISNILRVVSSPDGTTVSNYQLNAAPEPKYRSTL